MHEITSSPRTISKTSSGKIQTEEQIALLECDTLPPLEILFRFSSSSSSTKDTSSSSSIKVEEKPKVQVIEISEDLKRVVSRLKNEIADLMDTDADQRSNLPLDGNTSLLRLGLASMQIEQLRGVLLIEYTPDGLRPTFF